MIYLLAFSIGIAAGFTYGMISTKLV